METKQQPTAKQLAYYKHRYFIGRKINDKIQLIHFNKRGYELQNEIQLDVVVFSKKDKQHNNRFNTMQFSSFKNCEKIPCLKYLYGIERLTIKQHLLIWQYRLSKFFTYGR